MIRSQYLAITVNQTRDRSRSDVLLSYRGIYPCYQLSVCQWRDNEQCGNSQPKKPSVLSNRCLGTMHSTTFPASSPPISGSKLIAYRTNLYWMESVWNRSIFYWIAFNRIGRNVYCTFCTWNIFQILSWL